MLLKVEEAAKLLSLGRSTVYEMIANGTLPHVKIGSATRIPRDAMIAWIEANTRYGYGKQTWTR